MANSASVSCHASELAGKPRLMISVPACERVLEILKIYIRLLIAMIRGTSASLKAVGLPKRFKPKDTASFLPSPAGLTPLTCA